MSQIQPHTETIDGEEYTVYMLSPLVAMDLLVDLSKMLGPGLGPLADAMSGAVKGEGVNIGALLDMEIGGDVFSRAAESLFGNLDKGVVRTAIQTLAEVSQIGGAPLWKTFEVHFRGRLGTMSKWLAFALKVQYGDFFSALTGQRLSGQGMTPAVSLSPTG